jgi:hypothetical protein
MKKLTAANQIKEVLPLLLFILPKKMKGSRKINLIIDIFL